MKDEVWRPIRGYEGHYEISNHGNVRSLKNNKNKLLKNIIGYKGYRVVNLSLNDKKVKKYKIHVLVLEAFICKRPGPTHLIHACHNDGNRTNNHLHNLRWDSPRNNQLDLIKHNPKRHKLKESDILKIRKLSKEEGLSASQISRNYGVSSSHIRCILRKDRWNHI